MSDGRITTVEGMLLEAERVPNTPDGNPRFNVLLIGGFLYVTERDSAVNHTIAGWDPEAMRYTPLRLTLRWHSKYTAFHIIDIEILGNVAQSERKSNE